jgi:predicted deacetylase|tara:strand:+ start:2813 stop:3577 length:765 start_codon:yes stop_codon:yes gene_type:complete
MLNKVKKFISENTGFLIRLDDIAENMNWNMMELATNLFDKFNVKPVLGIIPNNSDPELLSYPKKNKNFWEEVRAWKDRGWKIAMHGNNHVYDKFCSKTDYLGLGGNSEFCSHTYEDQLEKIKNGLNKFNKENIEIKTFFAPNHTFDENTLLALKNCGITEIVDGYGLMPYEENNIKFVPQLFYKMFVLPFGIQTLQIHLNYFKKNDFDNFRKFIESNSEKIITYDQAISKLSNNLLSKTSRVITKKILQFKRLN